MVTKSYQDSYAQSLEKPDDFWLDVQECRVRVRRLLAKEENGKEESDDNDAESPHTLVRFGLYALGRRTSRRRTRETLTSIDRHEANGMCGMTDSLTSVARRSGGLFVIAALTWALPLTAQRGNQENSVSRPSDRFVSVNGVLLHHLDWGGDGETILFLAGLGFIGSIRSLPISSTIFVYHTADGRRHETVQ